MVNKKNNYSTKIGEALSLCKEPGKKELEAQRLAIESAMLGLESIGINKNHIKQFAAYFASIGINVDNILDNKEIIVAESKAIEARENKLRADKLSSEVYKVASQQTQS